MMKILIEKLDNLSVVAVSGHIDAVTCSDLEGALDGLIDKGDNQIILDFSEVPYISSAGLRVLLVGAKKLYGNGTLVLCALTEDVREILEMAGFENLMKIFDDLESAKNDLAAD